jgi:type I restriction enzyme R subunit
MKPALSSIRSPNFSFLAPHGDVLVEYGALAERYVFDDPNSTLIKLRQLAEGLAKKAAATIGLQIDAVTDFVGILTKLRDAGVLTPEVAELFHGLRKAGNLAVHDGAGTQREALHQLRMARTLGIWFHKAFGSNPNFKAGPFIPPPNPGHAETALLDELTALRQQIAAEQAQASTAKLTAAQEAKLRQEAEARAASAYQDLGAAFALAEEAERQLESSRKQFEQTLAMQQASAIASPVAAQQFIVSAVSAGNALDLSEADTRKLIDAQLREAGWDADTAMLRYASGTRPEKGKNIAIAEWPTASGPADYALFVGLMCVAVVEAKRKNKDVAGSIEQGKRYSKGFKSDAVQLDNGGPWGGYRVPFLFATNGRPFLRQLITKSGIWFLDGRSAHNNARALQGWYTPTGLSDLLNQQEQAAYQALQDEPTDYLPLRDFQKRAIVAVERALVHSHRQLLIAMATGTGKTRTCIGMVYRLIKAKRFNRVLFLVDRSALGEQATDAFKDVRLESLKTFTDIYDVKEMGDLTPDADTRLHVGTIQGMMRRIMQSEDRVAIPVDLYDCIVVDECHRGYTLDRELSDSEMQFRDEADYISKYRRVLDHFDAVKIGLTATPALHTVEIFGKPVFTYSYREAVIDGWLVDHEPPTQITTKLAKDGISWRAGSSVYVLKPRTNTVDLVNLPDDVNVEIDGFNSQVITENFNRAVCGELAKHIDPSLPGKTLIFCVNDMHADLVVTLLKAAFTVQYGSVEDDAVIKITGAADKPLQLLRRYKNERLPSVAVTVDLLTTGVDVPEITNLVFIRLVRSRILYEQMIGRATRLCPDLFGQGQNKEMFRIFDCVNLYAALEPYSSMKPVVVNPTITFKQLIKELSTVTDKKALAEIKDQFQAKFQRKCRTMNNSVREKFATAAGVSSTVLAGQVHAWPPKQIATFFEQKLTALSLLDAVTGDGSALMISKHDDEVIEVSHGYGKAKKPEDFLEAFKVYIKENINQIPALILVTQRPRDLTREQLKELALTLDQAGFSDTKLRTAWKDLTNQDIAASIIGFIRQSALGTSLVPYQDRVANAMQATLKSRAWTEPQRKWLQRIGAQLKLEIVVDRQAIDRGQFKTEGGFPRLNKVFDGKLDDLLKDINARVWEETPAA